MEVTPTPLGGAVLIQPQVFGDDRGFILHAGAGHPLGPDERGKRRGGRDGAEQAEQFQRLLHNDGPPSAY